MHKNRQRGAAKAAETRRAKRAAQQGTKASTCRQSTTSTTDEESAYCGVCGGQYIEVTDDVEDWICCDKCETWFHWVCADVIEEPESFLCKSCK